MKSGITSASTTPVCRNSAGNSVRHRYARPSACSWVPGGHPQNPCARLNRVDHRCRTEDGCMTSDLAALLSSLVAADSVNPSLVAGGAGEHEIATLIEAWARDAELETERLEETPGRPSVLVRTRGTGRGRPLLFCGHIDTVNVEGMPDAHTPRIEGGVELSSYPAHCKLGLERRTLPGETSEQIDAELAGLLEGCREADPEFEASHRTLLVREPFEIDQEEELVTLVAQAAAEVLPEPATIGGASYWADAAFIAAAGIPTVLFGPGGEGAHAIEEWVSISDTEAVARTLVGLAKRFCA